MCRRTLRWTGRRESAERVSIWWTGWSPCCRISSPTVSVPWMRGRTGWRWAVSWRSIRRARWWAMRSWSPSSEWTGACPTRVWKRFWTTKMRRRAGSTKSWCRCLNWCGSLPEYCARSAKREGLSILISRRAGSSWTDRGIRSRSSRMSGMWRPRSSRISCWSPTRLSQSTFTGWSCRSCTGRTTIPIRKRSANLARLSGISDIRSRAGRRRSIPRNCRNCSRRSRTHRRRRWSADWRWEVWSRQSTR